MWSWHCGFREEPAAHKVPCLPGLRCLPGLPGTNRKQMKITQQEARLSVLWRRKRNCHPTSCSLLQLTCCPAPVPSDSPSALSLPPAHLGPTHKSDLCSDTFCGSPLPEDKSTILLPDVLNTPSASHVTDQQTSFLQTQLHGTLLSQGTGRLLCFNTFPSWFPPNPHSALKALAAAVFP